MKKRLLFLIFGALVIGLMMTSLALAATPQDIYNDYADNFRLDSNYTDAELRAYLNDAHIHMYGDITITNPLDNLATEETTRDIFPFTGFQLMIAGIVAVVLVGGGIVLRRLSRPHNS